MIRSSMQHTVERTSKRNENNALNGSYSINSMPETQHTAKSAGLKRPNNQNYSKGTSNLQQLKAAILDSQKSPTKKGKSPSPKNTLFRANHTTHFKTLHSNLASGRKEESMNSSRVETAAAQVYSHIHTERESCNTSVNGTARTY